MSGPSPQLLSITDRQQEVLTQISRRQHAPASLVRRARMVLLAGAQRNNEQIAAELGCSREIVRLWRQRWAEGQEQVTVLEEGGESEHAVADRIALLLSDRPRPGAPPTFTPEQVVGVVALACTPPEQHGVPISHWTANALAREAMRQGLVPTISDRTVARFLK